MVNDKDEALKKQVEKQVARLKKAQQERSKLIAQTFFIGRLGLTFVLPVVVGAYLGRWLDGMSDGYGTSCTLSLILLGVFVGGFNIYLVIKESDDE